MGAIWALNAPAKIGAHPITESENVKKNSVGRPCIYAPPSFTTLDQKEVVFADFLDAHSTLIFDPIIRDAYAVSSITFETHDQDFPAVSLKQPFVSGTPDGESISLDEPKSMDSTMSFKILSKPVSPSRHQLHSQSKISRPVVTRKHPVTRSFGLRLPECKFAMTDLAPGTGFPEVRFLRACLPANLEFDHVRMRVTVILEYICLLFRSRNKRQMLTHFQIIRKNRDRDAIQGRQGAVESRHVCGHVVPGMVEKGPTDGQGVTVAVTPLYWGPVAKCRQERPSRLRRTLARDPRSQFQPRRWVSPKV